MSKTVDRIKNSIKRETSGVAIPFIAFGAALNLSLGQITGLLKIPLYLDSLGTVLVAVLCGPWAGAVTGIVANTSASILFNPPMVFFLPTVLVIGAFSGFWAKRGLFQKWYAVLPGGILQGILAALVSAPISAYLFSGVTLGGTDFLVMYFRAIGKSLLESTLLQGLAADPVDKTITYLIAFLIIKKLPYRLVIRFPRYENVIPAAD